MQAASAGLWLALLTGAPASPPPPVNLPGEVAHAIAACWHPPHEGGDHAADEFSP